MVLVRKQQPRMSTNAKREYGLHLRHATTSHVKSLGSSGFIDAVWIKTLSHTNGAHVRSEPNQTLVQGANNEEVGIQTLCFDDSGRLGRGKGD